MLHQRPYIYIILAGAALLLIGCASQTATVTVTPLLETVVVTATPPRSSIPTPAPPPTKTLTVCLVGEPDTLYLYGYSHIPATRHVMEALYDGPVDNLEYTYQPVLLQEIPSVTEGDVIVRRIQVREGFHIVNAKGDFVELVEGVRLRPAGCYADECAVEFEGESLWMERMEISFVLREGLTWADGEPLTAGDSAFAFQVASDPATPGNHYLTDRTAYYRPLSDQRVQWIGVPGFIPASYVKNFFAPLPRHQLEGRSPAELLKSDDTRRTPLGWGPFSVEEWVSGDHITLSRNRRYFRAAEGLPYLDHVVFRFTSGASDMIADLLAGKCDIGVQDGDFRPFMPLLIQAEQDGLLKVASAPGNGWEHIDFGIAPAPDYRRADIFEDVRVRQAVVQCIDRQAIVDEVTYGRSAVSDSYLPPEHPLYPDDQLTHWDYDPAAGRALLEEVGWVDNDESGVREAHQIQGVRTGTPFEIAFLTSEESLIAQRVAPIVEAHLADCGIRVNLEARPAGGFFTPGPEGEFLGRKFDLAETAWWSDSAPPCDHYLSPGSLDEGGWQESNPSGYSNPDYDIACRRALQALPGTVEYEEYHKRAQIVFSQELPAIPLFARMRLAVIRPGVLNFALDPTARSELWNIEELDVE